MTMTKSHCYVFDRFICRVMRDLFENFCVQNCYFARTVRPISIHYSFNRILFARITVPLTRAFWFVSCFIGNLKHVFYRGRWLNLRYSCVVLVFCFASITMRSYKRISTAQLRHSCDTTAEQTTYSLRLLFVSKRNEYIT